MTSTASTSNRMFADLNILYNKTNPKMTADCLKHAVALGYDTLAVNVELLDFDNETAFSDVSNQSQKKSLKKSAKITTIIPNPPKFKLDAADLVHLERQNKKFRLYTRLTLGLTDTSQVHCILKMPTVQEYDILAVWPKTEEMFNTIIKKMEIDLISMDMTQKASWVSRKNLVQMAVEKGITFEINYAPALNDSSVRREVFSNGRELFRATKGRGLIISSRVEKPIEIRSPYDVANIGFLFGMTPEQGARTLSQYAKELLLHAESKKTVKGVLSVKHCSLPLNSSSALCKLLNVPEFRAEIQAIRCEDGNLKRKSAEHIIINDEKKPRLEVR